MPELILGPIVGGLNAEGANLWGRANGRGKLYAWLGRQADLSDAALAGESQALTAEDGYAGVVRVSGLAAGTRYHYTLTLSADPPGPEGTPYPAFSTFPPTDQRVDFNFAFGACFRPSSPDGGQIFNALDKRRQLDNLRFIILTGDQIYADEYRTNSLGRIAVSLADYRAVYEYTWSRPPWRSLMKNLPAFMTLDDHEVDDDWCWRDETREWAYLPFWDQVERWLRRCPPQERHLPRARVLDALEAYWEHQLMHAPPFLDPPMIHRGGHFRLEAPGCLAYTFNFGATPFFVLDARTRRTYNPHIMLGPEQWAALEQWLLAVKDAPVKFLVSSSVCLFSMWADIPRDRWPGYPAERRRLLNFLAEHGIQNLYLIVGDIHAAHAMRAELAGPEGQAIPLWEFCSTPFEQACNWLARPTYWPFPSKPVRRQQLKFSVAKCNFGLVRVRFDAAGQAHVHYEVYGTAGELLGEAGEV
jgi:phosphodiesterase/alkaline phosphatase D-like protein